MSLPNLRQLVRWSIWTYHEGGRETKEEETRGGKGEEMRAPCTAIMWELFTVTPTPHETGCAASDYG